MRVQRSADLLFDVLQPCIEHAFHAQQALFHCLEIRSHLAAQTLHLAVQALHFPAQAVDAPVVRQKAQQYGESRNSRCNGGGEKLHLVVRHDFGAPFFDPQRAFAAKRAAALRSSGVVLLERSSFIINA